MTAAELFVEAISNPMAALKAAMGLSLRSDLATDDVKILRGILQPWWDTEQDPRSICRYLGALGEAEGQGSVAHRRAVRMGVICAKTALPLVREMNRAETARILDILDAWACGKASDADLPALREDARIFWSVADAADAVEAAAIAAAAATNAIATYAATAAIPGYKAPAAAAAAASDAADAVAFAHPAAMRLHGTPEWTAAKARHLFVMADMIRGEIPVCPMRLP